MESSNASRPSRSSCMIRMAVKGLVMDPISNLVLAEFGMFHSALAENHHSDIPQAAPAVEKTGNFPARLSLGMPARGGGRQARRPIDTLPAPFRNGPDPYCQNSHAQLEREDRCHRNRFMTGQGG